MKNIKENFLKDTSMEKGPISTRTAINFKDILKKI